VSAAALKSGHAHGLRGEADERCAKNDDRERYVQKENADECSGSE
jgi:hypothetical protein